MLVYYCPEKNNIVILFKMGTSTSKGDQLIASSSYPITTIITTCCRKSAPNTDMIVNNVKNIRKFAPALSQKIIIVFDGPIIENSNLDIKCQGPCNNKDYKAYIKNTQERILALLPNSKIQFIEMHERGCLVNSLRAGIKAADTDFINIMQEDLILQKPIPVDTMISEIQNNDDIDVIRYDREQNQYHWDYNLKYCQSLNLFKRTILVNNNTYFSKSNQYSDQCHITTKEYYNKFIFPNVDEYSFMEHKIICKVGNIIPDTIWHLGKYEDGYYIKHLDGRNN